MLLPRPLPTPVLAYAVRALDAVAGVMVTASHNPPQDNGYKVYLGAGLGGPDGAGAQIVPPADAEIEAAIKAVGTLAEVPLGDPGTVLGRGRSSTGTSDGAVAVLDPQRRRRGTLTVAYTPLHGVGGAVLVDAFVQAGFAAPAVVPEQVEPDPDFPTVAFPNPEEPGAMDRVTRAGRRGRRRPGHRQRPGRRPVRGRGADPVGGSGAPLRGDELGALLADHLIRRGTTGVYATTIVSSSLLRAPVHGARAAVRRDADRVQVDRPRRRGPRRTATRRRSATAWRPDTSGTRTASPRR